MVRSKKFGQKTNQKNLIKAIKSKSICPKWHFNGVGHGGKKTIWGFFDQISLSNFFKFLIVELFATNGT
jgi:hypothetical protein